MARASSWSASRTRLYLIAVRSAAITFRGGDAHRSRADIHDNKFSGVYYDKSMGEIRQCRIYKNRDNAVHALEGSVLTVVACGTSVTQASFIITADGFGHLQICITTALQPWTRSRAPRQQCSSARSVRTNVGYAAQVTLCRMKPLTEFVVALCLRSRRVACTEQRCALLRGGSLTLVQRSWTIELALRSVWRA